jgi:hypothetical protein
MNRLSLDFAHGGRSVRLAIAALLIGAAGVLHALWQRESLLTQQDAQQTQTSRLERALSRQALRHSTTARENPKALAAARTVAVELQRPWESMLDAVQKASRADLTITRLQPESSAYRLAVTGQADSSEAFLAFVSRLRQQPQWSEVTPVRQELPTTTALSAGTKPLSFQIVLQWGRHDS